MATENASWLKKAYKGLVRGESFLGNFLLLAIRLYWGSLLVITGSGKLMNIHQVADYFTSLDIPYPLFSAYLTACIEFFGGISLVLGFLTRFSSLLLTVMLCVAYATAHKDVFQQPFLSAPAEFIKQEPFLFLYASLVVLCFGSGLFSFDYWIEKRKIKL